MGNQKKWVAASDVGSAAYCPHSLELKHKGIKVTAQAEQARERGNAAHDELNRQALQDSRCFIATHLYGEHDVRTQLLRDFRDQVLKSSLLGQLFISVYYRLSPMLVSMARRWPWLSLRLGTLVGWLFSCIDPQRSTRHD